MSDVIRFTAARRTSRGSQHAGWLDGGTLRAYDAPVPTDGDTALTKQTLLAVYDLPSPAGTVTDGVFTVRTLSQQRRIWPMARSRLSAPTIRPMSRSVITMWGQSAVARRWKWTISASSRNHSARLLRSPSPRACRGGLRAASGAGYISARKRLFAARWPGFVWVRRRAMTARCRLQHTRVALMQRSASVVHLALRLRTRTGGARSTQ